MRPRSKLRRFGFVGLAFVALAFGLDRMFPPDLSRYISTSTEIKAANGSLLNVFETHDGRWRLRTEIHDVDPRYIAMLCAYEDKRFYNHPGIDPLAMARAATQWIGHGHIVSGGSTLTMQVARLLEPHRRSLPGKIKEMIRAVQLEERFSKDKILDMYLTLAPFGGNLEGVRAASLAYFGKEPATLSTAEAALLVALPQSPTRREPDRHPEAAQVARTKVLTLIAASRPDLVESADSETAIPFVKHPFPALAAHFSRRLAQGNDGQIIPTTIDAASQGHIEAIAREAANTLDVHASIAILAVDNRTHGVIAAIGGRDQSAPGGYVNMMSALRSPGSALKPFIYGLAFDDTAIHPETLIDDTAMHFAGYAPHDFDGHFHGLVTVREALQQSLNIPAIAVMQRIGPGRLTAALGGAGVRLALPKSSADPGLAIALGGVGISLRDLMMLYSSLATGGTVFALKDRSDDESATGQPLLSPVAAYYVTSILKDSPTPDGIAPTTLTTNTARIAWKTGTSYGFRDAWAVGYTPAYTVGIWVGRVEGTPRPGSYGRNTAAPLMFKIFDSLPYHAEINIPKPPKGVIHANSNADLPRGLRYFTAPNQSKTALGPRIVYPPAASTVDLVRDDKGSWKQLEIATEGGTGALRFFVNGQPLAPTTNQQFLWRPDGPGFTTITVIDDHDIKAVSQFRLVLAQ